jgi:hypothetical protein
MKTIPLYTFLLFSLAVHAQKNSYGALFGPQASTYNGNMAIASTNICAGFFYQHRVLKIEALYSQKGARFGHVPGDTTDNYKLLMPYWELNATYQVCQLLSIGGYVEALGSRARAQYYYDEGNFSWLTGRWDIVHKLEAGAVADFHVPVDWVTFGARAEYSLTPVGRLWYSVLKGQHNSTLHFYMMIPFTKHKN